MQKELIHSIVEKQKAYFLSGATLDVKERIKNLKKLHEAVRNYEEKLRSALKIDLGKSSFESDMCEVRLTESEISYMISHTKRFSKDKSNYSLKKVTESYKIEALKNAPKVDTHYLETEYSGIYLPGN